MITRGLSCDRVGFGHFGGGQMTPLTPPWLRACTVQYYSAISVHSLVELITLSRIINELCSKVVADDMSCQGYYREISPAVFIHK